MPKAPGSSRNRAQVDIGRAGSAAGRAGWTRVAAESLPPPPFHSPRSIESPNLGFGMDPFLPHLLEDEQGQLSDLEPELDAQNWQHTVSRELVANLPQKEIDRQEVINGEEHGAPRGREGPPGCASQRRGAPRALLHPCAFRTELFATEWSHLRILRVLDLLFYQRMKKESLLSREELALLFPNLPELIEIHSKPLPARILRWEQRVAHGCQGLLCCHPPFQSGPTDGITAPSSPFSLLGEIQSLFLLGSANTPVWDTRRTHFWCHGSSTRSHRSPSGSRGPFGAGGYFPKHTAGGPGTPVTFSVSFMSLCRFSLRIYEEAPGRRTNHQGNWGSHAVSGKGTPGTSYCPSLWRGWCLQGEVDVTPLSQRLRAKPGGSLSPVLPHTHAV